MKDELTTCDSLLRFDFLTDKYGDELLVDVGSTQELPGFRFHRTPHQLMFYDVLLLRRGQGRLLQEDRWHAVGPGTVAFHVPGERRRWMLSDDAEGLVLFFTDEFIRSFLCHATFLQALPFFGPGGEVRTLPLAQPDRVWMERRLLSMQSEIHERAWGRDLALQAACYDILVRLGRRAREHHPQLSSDLTAAPAWLSRFQEAVERDFRSDRTVGHYARCAGLSPSHLSHMVRDRLGRSVGEIVRARVLLEARRGLLHTELSVREIARLCGFDDPSYFVRYFRRYVGCTPASYRRTAAKVGRD